MTAPILTSATDISNGDVTMEITSVVKLSLALLHHFWPFFVVFLFWNRMKFCKINCKWLESISVSRKTFFGTCMPRFNKIHPEYTFSHMSTKSHECVWDDPWLKLCMGPRAMLGSSCTRLLDIYLLYWYCLYSDTKAKKCKLLCIFICTGVLTIFHVSAWCMFL